MSYSSKPFAGALFAFLTLVASDVAATPLPPTLQAELIVRVAGYDKGLRARAGDAVRVLIVVKVNDDDPWAEKLRAGFLQTDKIGGLAHIETVARYATATELAKTVRRQQIAIVVLPASLGDDVEAVRSSLDGVNVLTVVPDGDLVRRGVVLGFELVSGKPHLFFNTSQASRQHVVMSADVMKLMKVFE